MVLSVDLAIIVQSKLFDWIVIWMLNVLLEATIHIISEWWLCIVEVLFIFTLFYMIVELPCAIF